MAPRARRVSAPRARPNTHTVASGEACAISVRGRDAQELKAANAKALGRGDTIYPGQQLIVPRRQAVHLRAFRVRPTRAPAGAYNRLRPPTRLRNPANLAKKWAWARHRGCASRRRRVWMFKEDEPGRGAGRDPRDAYGGPGNYDRALRGRQGGGYYDQYNQGDWRGSRAGNGGDLHHRRPPAAAVG